MWELVLDKSHRDMEEINRSRGRDNLECQRSTLENNHAKLVSRHLRKSSKIDDFMYSFQNSITVKEELAQLNDMFKMLVDSHEELEQRDKEYTNDIWFDGIDQKVFSFKCKVHSWLKEEEKDHERSLIKEQYKIKFLYIQIFNSRKSSGGKTGIS